MNNKQILEILDSSSKRLEDIAEKLEKSNKELKKSGNKMKEAINSLMGISPNLIIDTDFDDEIQTC